MWVFIRAEKVENICNRPQTLPTSHDHGFPVQLCIACAFLSLHYDLTINVSNCDSNAKDQQKAHRSCPRVSLRTGRTQEVWTRSGVLANTPIFCMGVAASRVIGLQQDSGGLHKKPEWGHMTRVYRSVKLSVEATAGLFQPATVICCSLSQSADKKVAHQTQITASNQN